MVGRKLVELKNAEALTDSTSERIDLANGLFVMARKDYNESRLLHKKYTGDDRDAQIRVLQLKTIDGLESSIDTLVRLIVDSYRNAPSGGTLPAEEKKIVWKAIERADKLVTRIDSTIPVGAVHIGDIRESRKADPRL